MLSKYSRLHKTSLLLTSLRCPVIFMSGQIRPLLMSLMQWNSDDRWYSEGSHLGLSV